MRRCRAIAAVLSIVAACGGEDGSGPSPVSVASVELSAPLPYLEQGSSLQLIVVVRDADGNGLTDRAVDFTSSDESVATVSSSGLVTGRAPGDVTVRATSEGRSAAVDLGVRETGPLPAELGGTIRRVRFEIADAATHVAVGDLTVFADEAIDVRGSLLAHEGVSITLVAAGALSVSGFVGDTTTVIEPPDDPFGGGPSAVGVSAWGADSQHEGDVLMSGNQVDISGRVHANDGQSVVVVGLGDQPRGVISGEVRGGTGTTGEDGVGLAGGAVLIGSGAALQRATGRGVGAVPFSEVRIAGAEIRGGQGGVGAVKHVFDHVGADLATVATRPGGPGGDVEISASALVRFEDQPLLRAGQGGSGGRILAIQDFLIRAPDGAGPGAKGVGVEAISGRGGDGGGLAISSPSLARGLRWGPGPGRPRWQHPRRARRRRAGS